MPYRISGTKDLDRLKKEIEDNFASFDNAGNLSINGDIYAKDAYLAEESLYLGSVKISAPEVGDDARVLQAVTSDRGRVGGVVKRTKWGKFLDADETFQTMYFMGQL